MKRRITQGDIAKRINIDQGSVSRILNHDTRDSFSDKTIKEVFKIAREMGYLHPALLTTNRRLSGRKRVELRARIKIITGSNAVFDEGSCEIAEISQSGCLLHKFRTKTRTFPMDPFVIDLEINEPNLKNFYSRCRVIRFADDPDALALAIQFEGLSEDRKDKLREFLK